MSRKFDNLKHLKNRILPSTHNLSVGDLKPRTEFCLFVAPNAYIRGNVQMDFHSVVNYSASIDCMSTSSNDIIKIGKRSIIQDLASIKAFPNESVTVGDRSLIGHNTIIRNSIIGNNVYVGPSCHVINSTIEDGAYLAPGTVVKDSIVKANNVVCRNPFEVLRTVNTEEREYLDEMLEEQKKLAIIFANEISKTAGEKIEAKNDINDRLISISEEDYMLESLRQLENAGFGTSIDDQYFNTYRGWVLEEMQAKRFQRYKDEEYEGIDFDQRPKELFGAFMPNLNSHVKIQELAAKRASEKNIPDIAKLEQTENYKDKINEINKESNKF